MCNEFHQFQEFAVHTDLKSVGCSGKQTLRRVWLRTHETPVICSAEPQLQIFLQLFVDQRLCQCGIYLLSHEVLHHTLDIPDLEKFQGAFRHPSKHDLNWSFYWDVWSLPGIPDIFFSWNIVIMWLQFVWMKRIIFWLINQVSQFDSVDSWSPNEWGGEGGDNKRRVRRGVGLPVLVAATC